MKYISSRVWITNERTMLVCLKTGNKRGRTRMEIWVNSDYHACLRCPYNARTCNMMCQKLEGIPELKEKIKEEFGIIIGPKITPLLVERLKAKW